MLFLLPIAVSLVSLQLAANNEPMKGFSGIVYGFAGYLLYSNIKNTNIRKFLNDICKKSNLKKQKNNSRFIYKSVVLLMALLYPFFALIEIMIPAHYAGYMFGIFVPFVMEKLCLKNAA